MEVNNIGTKIKTLVKVVCVLGCIACVIMFFIGCSAYIEDKDYIEYATVNGGAYGYSSLQRAGDNAYSGKMMMIYSAICALVIGIGAMPLYGFGVLVENSDYSAKTTYLLDQKLTNIENQLKKLSTASPGTNNNISTNTPSNPSSFKLPEL